ncbi:alpha/beta hydrolase [Curtobacterium flaccumfaciens]|uniref:alpha/beta hydrolase n=1 Tax=Curtobacterium flaccumfaciens TaxID=2035 RepID=UPI001BE0D026|nr:alpha/beta hydrolase [Curtobacterium flaccumfaciens]MBT1583972.1 alpha/beta hydrolase [Curtobacterium flaccumfaciens pv. flaccumfaciens]MCX2797524.1 alpha/beta hydrolase [Curtobacterium flaccumfaciens pv. flaccumfaciens]
MEILFVHGALVRDGDWWWQPTADLLFERTGVRSRSVALPSCGEGPSGRPEGGLAEDAAALRAALDHSDGAIVVGHSYGGTVIAEAGHHGAVEHLVSASSYLPDVGSTQAGIVSDEPDPVAIGDAGDGALAVVGYDASSFGARFLQDADPQVQRAAWDRVTAQSAAAFVTPTTAAGWQGVDSTYLVCTEDRSTTVGLQRAHAARATRSVDVPTGHHPFITRPDLVVEQLELLLGSTAA